jgi:hypothetical protein
MRASFGVVALVRALSRAVALLRSTLREIFDESAYVRFLQRNKLASSREAYAKFVGESQESDARRPRCC